MDKAYLHVTSRKGRPFAAYYYLHVGSGEKVSKTVKASPGILIDYGTEGDPIGLEITSPGEVALIDINRILRRLEAPLLDPEDFASLRNAAP